MKVRPLDTNPPMTGTIFENPLAAVLFVMLMPMRRRLCLTTGYQVMLMRARFVAWFW